MSNCGIYAIRHVETGKVYIGSSANLRSRWTAHRSRLRRSSHHSPQLQRAWNKYGEGAFVFEVIEQCSVDALLTRENFHISAMLAAIPAHGYNFAPVAGTTRGIKLGPLSDEHRRAIATAKTGVKASPEHRASLSAARTGRKLTPEWRANIAVANTGRKMAPLSAEHKAIVSKTHKGKTISEAHRQAVRNALKGKAQSPELVRKRMESRAVTMAAKKASLEQPCSGPLAQIGRGT